MGPSKAGEGNTFLQVQSETPNTNLGSPQSLQYNFINPDVQVFTNSQGWLRQVVSLDRVIDIVTNTANSYLLFFYHSSDIAGVSTTNGCYYFANAPYQSVMIALLGTNHLQVTDSTYPNTADYLWETNGWALITGGGLRTETLLQTTNGSTYTKVRTIQGASGVTNFYSSETWQIFSYGARLIQETVGTGAAARSTTNVYTADGMLQQVNRTDGSWDYYAYDSMDRQIGHYSPFLNSPFTTNVALCRYTTNCYDSGVVSGSGDCANLEFCVPRMVVESVLGNEVSRNYTVELYGERRDYQCTGPGAAWNNASNLVTETDTRTDAIYLGEPWRIIRPDYTMQLFAYDDNTTCPAGTGSRFSKTTIWTGAPDMISMTSVIDGTMDESWTDSMMRNVMHRVTDVASGTVIEQEVYAFDALNHVTNTVYLSRTATGASYDCCNLESSVAQDGTVTSYGYDALKRQVLTVQNGIISSNILDANDDLLGTVRFGTDSTAITNGLATYDTSGQMTSSTDGLGNVTVYTNYFDASNQLIKMTTYPDASTRVETYARDGSLLSVTGTAVLPVQYAYGVQTDGGVQRFYQTETKLNTNGTASAESVTNFMDTAGRDYKTVYASASGTPASQSIYNSYGQLSEQVDPDGVMRMYGYNAKGQAVTNATDMNGNGAIDFGGSDRISATISDVISNAYNLYVNRMRTFVWLTNGSSVSNLVATAETAVDGLQSWNIVWNNGVGVTNYSRTAYIPSAGQMIWTSVGPDGSSTVSTTQNGRQVSVIQYDANGVQLGSTVFGYDAHGRQNLVSDGRNGTSVSYFNNNDRVTSVLTPSPDGVSAGELTTNVLDSRGRVIRTILPDAAVVTNLYYPNSLLQETYGSRTYPVAYTYDYAGRMKTMTTWTNFSTSGGAAVTTWNYDGYRGFLTNKVYADSHGPGYGYTAAGRLNARVWARGITTSYGYDSAGGLSTVGYSDGTPGTTNGYDRLGRQVAVTNGATVCNWTYNNVSELLSETYTGGPLNGLSVTNGYDSLLRRKNLSLLNSSTAVASTLYGYDAASRLATVGDGTNVASYGYLANSALVGNIGFQRNGTTVMTTTKQYDLLNRLTSIGTVGGTNSFTYNYSYNAANQRTSVTNADNSYWVYQYDSLGQVISGKRYWAAGTPVAGQQLTYNFDDIGNRKSTASGGDATGSNLRSASYLINNLNEYTSRSVPGYATVLGSANSNATVSVNLQRAWRQGNYFADELPVTNTSTAIYQSLTNLAVLNNGTNADITVTNVGSVLVPQTPEAFVYDLDGNMTTNGRWTVLWDGENRATNFTSLSTLPTTAKIKVDCAYDYQGRRVQKIVSTNNGTVYISVSTNRYIYDGWNLIGILDGGNNLQYSFQWGTDLSGSMQGAGGVGGLISMTVYGGVNAGTYDYAYDGNGNVTGLINTTSGSAAQYEYDTFGNVMRTTGALALTNPFQFSTKYYDLETRLNYYGYRYYDAGVGRWFGKDPIGERGGKNIYGIIGNNLINSVDYFGLYSITGGPSSGYQVLDNNMTGVNSYPSIGATVIPQMTHYTTFTYKEGNQIIGPIPATQDMIMNPGVQTVMSGNVTEPTGRQLLWVGPANMLGQVSSADYTYNYDPISIDKYWRDKQNAQDMQGAKLMLEGLAWLDGAGELGWLGKCTKTADTGAGSSTLQDYLSGSGGRWGGSDTRSLNDAIATYFEDQGQEVVNGAGRESEQWIPGPNGGTKGGTWVDITLKAPDGSVTRIQTISTLSDGVTPTANEAAAAARIQTQFPNDTLILIAKPK